MSIPGPIKSWICTFVSHRLGGYITSVAGGLVGAVCAWLAHTLHWTLDDVTQAKIDGALVLLGTALANGSLQWWKSGNIQDFQETVSQALQVLGLKPLKKDGWAGDETKSAVALVIRKAALAIDEDVVQTLASITPSTNTTPSGYRTAAGK